MLTAILLAAAVRRAGPPLAAAETRGRARSSRARPGRRSGATWSARATIRDGAGSLHAGGALPRRRRRDGAGALHPGAGRAGRAPADPGRRREPRAGRGRVRLRRRRCSRSTSRPGCGSTAIRTCAPIVETADGALYMTGRFVRASGGCSAPASKDAAAALAALGQMKVRWYDGEAARGRREAQVMLRHPNYSGLQRDQLTHLYIPPHFVDSLEVRQGDEVLFSMSGGISISEDPTFPLRLHRQRSGRPVGHGDRHRGRRLRGQLSDRHVIPAPADRFRLPRVHGAPRGARCSRAQLWLSN